MEVSPSGVWAENIDRSETPVNGLDLWRALSLRRRRPTTLAGARQQRRDEGGPPVVVKELSYQLIMFISNYHMAVGFLKALRQYQLRRPQDVPPRATTTCGSSVPAVPHEGSRW